MYELRYDCVKSKYGEERKLCYIDKDSFILYINTKDIYINKNDVENVLFKMMLKQDLILQIMNQTDYYLNEKIKKLLD